MVTGALFGYELESELPLARLGAGPAPRGTIVLRRAAAPVELAGAETVMAATDGDFSFTLARRDGQLLACCSATGGFALDPAAVAVETDAERLDELWEHRVLGTIVPLLLAELGELVVHASAVEVGGSAFLFAGLAGRGKSTLALALAEAGARLVAEDGVVVTLGEEPLAWPGPTGVRVAAAGAGKTTRLLAADSHAAEPRRVGGVLALGERRAGGLEVAPVDAVSAVPLLLPNLIFAGRAALPRAFRLAARLAAAAPVARASLPDDLDALPGVARELQALLLTAATERRFAALVPGGA